MFLKKDKSIEMSIPSERTVHGVRIWKLPTGQYLKVLSTYNNLPEILLKSCFPDMKPIEVMNELKLLNETTLYNILGRLMKVIPEQFLRIVAELIDAEYDHLVNKLSPKELLEVIKAFIEVNEVKDFLDILKTMFSENKVSKKTTTGFKSFLRQQ